MQLPSAVRVATTTANASTDVVTVSPATLGQPAPTVSIAYPLLLLLYRVVAKYAFILISIIFIICLIIIT